MAMETTESPTPPKRTRRRKLSTVADVKKTLARLLRMVESNEVQDMEKARVMIYGLSKLAHIMQASDFEERLARLEAQGHQAVQ